MVLLVADVLAVESSPHKVDNQIQGLGKELSPDDTDVTQEGPVPSDEGRVNVHASKSMGHFFAFVEGHDLQIMALIATLYVLKQCLRIIS